MKNTTILQLASAYLLPGKIFIHSNSNIQKSAWFASEPFISLDIQSAPEEIGKALFTALGNTKIDVEKPNDLRMVTERLIRAAQMPSYRKFQQSATYCSVTKTKDNIEITPSSNGGTRGDNKGFQYIIACRQYIEVNVSLEQLGKELLHAFTLCSSIYK